MDEVRYLSIVNEILAPLEATNCLGIRLLTNKAFKEKIARQLVNERAEETVFIEQDSFLKKLEEKKTTSEYHE